MRGRRLLFVTYAFPPLRRVGCVRTWNTAKYLARAGWAVTVLTVDPSLWRTVEYPPGFATNFNAEGIRRLSTGHRWRWLAGHVNYSNDWLSRQLWKVGRPAAGALGIDGSIGWVRPAEKICASLTRNDVDLVLASGPPFSAFPLAQRLANRLHRPYVLDYRDLWSHHLHKHVPAAAKREASALAESAAVITVSPSWARVIDQQFQVGAKLHVVSNGYDPEHLATIRAHHFGHFAIVYAGALWPPRRTIAPVMAALRRLKDIAPSQAPWMFHYYGAQGLHVRTEAERFGVMDKVIDHGVVPRETALEAVKGSGVAVVVTSVASNATLRDNGMVTGKIFEPIGLGTPVLLIAPDGSDADVVVQTAGLGRRYAAGDVDGIASLLTELMNGKSLEPKDTGAYAWPSLVSTLNEVLCDAIRAQ